MSFLVCAATVAAAFLAFGHHADARQAQSDVTAPRAPASIIAPDGKYLGVAASAGSVPGFAAAVGRRPDIIAEYVQVGSPFMPPPPGMMAYVSLATAALPTAVIAGADDGALRSYGRALAAYGKPVVVSVDPEGNGP
jgi:hypothetical protein